MKYTAFKYKLPPLEPAVNSMVRSVFYYRLLFVAGALALTGFAGAHVYHGSPPAEALKNAGLIITFGSVVIGIFYSILNYEHNQFRFRHDVQVSRELLTFTSSCKMHEADTIGHFRTLKGFYDDHRSLFQKSDYAELQQRFKNNHQARISFIVLFNYFEGISIGVQQGIMDEVFMKEFFKTVFIEYHKYFKGYIEYLRSEARTPAVFRRFTEVAERWRNEN